MDSILHIVRSDNRSFFENLLYKDKNLSIYVKNFQKLIKSIFKVAKTLSAPIVRKIFEKRNHVYHLPNPSEFVLLKVHSIFYGIESISYLAPYIWSMA